MKIVIENVEWMGREALLKIIAAQSAAMEEMHQELLASRDDANEFLNETNELFRELVRLKKAMGISS